ncbi:MAG: DNA-directed RNA polymerase subunit omega [Acidimicrobiales bacterium]
MVERHDTMMNPPVEHLLNLTGSKFRLVTVASLRARQINSYFNQLGDGLGAMVPPQVTSLARKPLSIAFEEIDAGKIVPVDRVDEDAVQVAFGEYSQGDLGADGPDPVSVPTVMEAAPAADPVEVTPAGADGDPG